MNSRIIFLALSGVLIASLGAAFYFLNQEEFGAGNNSPIVSNTQEEELEPTQPLPEPQPEPEPSPIPPPAGEPDPPPPPPASEYEPQPVVHTVFMEADGFHPRVLTIKQRDTVTWVNNDIRPHWPSTDLHPVHLNYPGLDPFRELFPGEEWSFIFNRIGEWGIHDHIYADLTGTIIVTE